MLLLQQSGLSLRTSSPHYALAGERAFERASEAAAERAGERALERVSERAFERAGERALERMGEALRPVYKQLLCRVVSS